MRLVLLIAVLALTACQRDHIEQFSASSCGYADTGEWRTRNERGACIVHSAGHTANGHHYSGSCIVYATNTVHEKLQRVSCVKTQWVRR